MEWLYLRVVTSNEHQRCSSQLAVLSQVASKGTMQGLCVVVPPRHNTLIPAVWLLAGWAANNLWCYHLTIIDLQGCFQKMAADIMSKLFEADLDEVLREIFFNLDSVSIRSSRCGFLRNTIWHFTEAWDKGLKIPQLSQKRGVITFLLLLFHRFAFPQMRLPPMEWIHQATHPSKQVSLPIIEKWPELIIYQSPDLDGRGWWLNSTTNGSIGHRFPHTWRQ